MLLKQQALLVMTLLLVLCSCAKTKEIVVDDMSCPDSPNCVSSQAADPAHFIEPFTFKDKPTNAMSRLKAALLNEKRVTIVKETAGYLHAEVRSLLFRFVDDVEFTLLPDKGLIHIRSASRSGYSDFGVNRRRLERIRQSFQE